MTKYENREDGLRLKAISYQYIEISLFRSFSENRKKSRKKRLRTVKTK